MQEYPLITILITTKDRPDDLCRTLNDLKRQDYPAVEMLVIDDGSSPTLESVVREAWPTAVYVREAESRGCPQRRSEGFLLATGEYIVELDDDSSPVAPDALSRAVRYMGSNSGIGALGFHIYNGLDLPANFARPEAKYAYNFVGCGVLFRTAAVREVGGYQAFFEGEWEESEFCLRLLKAGWSVYFFPDVLIHHRVSPVQRRAARSWTRGFRNKLWGLIIHYPARRLVLEGTWVLALAGWDSIRLFRVPQFMNGLGQFLNGLPRAVGLRHPMTMETLRLYDALRFRSIRSEDQLRSPPSFGVGDIFKRFRQGWLNRPRQRSIWDHRLGDVGKTDTMMFSHEFTNRTEGASSADVISDIGNQSQR